LDFDNFFSFRRKAGRLKTVIARSEATKQSQKGVENKGVAALPSVARHNENGVLRQTPERRNTLRKDAQRLWVCKKL